jgi:hypothetical protein
MYNMANPGGFWDLIHHLVLPAVTTAATSVAIVTRVTRGALIDTLGQPYILSARARGLSDFRVTYRHGVRNVMPTFANMCGLQIGYLFGGAIFTEIIFNWPGIGLQLYNAILQRDVPMVQGCILAIESPSWRTAGRHRRPRPRRSGAGMAIDTTGAPELPGTDAAMLRGRRGAVDLRAIWRALISDRCATGSLIVGCRRQLSSHRDRTYGPDDADPVPPAGYRHRRSYSRPRQSRSRRASRLITLAPVADRRHRARPPAHSRCAAWPDRRILRAVRPDHRA